MKCLRIQRMKQLKRCRPKRLAENQETLEFSLLSIYAGRDDSSISSEPLQEERFSSVPISDESPPGGTLYNGLYGDVLPERGNFLRLEVHKRVGILRVKV